MLMKPLNDKKCLTLLHNEIQHSIELPEARDFAAQFSGLGHLAEYIRNLDQRDDLGDPNDGPRLPCEVSQRLRFTASDPNCVERTAKYIRAAEILDPDTKRTTASLVMDNGWHTFPVEFRDGRPEIVDLDPIGPPRNIMVAAAYRARNASPSSHIGPWFDDMAWNACCDECTEDVYHRALASLRNSLFTGEAIGDPDAVQYIMDLAAHESDLWGAHGRAAYNRVARSMRNLAIKLDTELVKQFVDKLIDTTEKLAPDAIKTALISQYGPAAAIALQGVDVVLAQEPKQTAPARSRKRHTARAHLPTATRVRRMTLAIR